ncbi:tannase/feruloyl esterase family alpha/beta hydrolase [Alteraurantiacibacter buctensis]|uniref:Tannase/feruloyl esterase family alpha/beta hydrolase n=1 Tax=Alteraurantiacibacter buctensis TaxID=1503981 RepID=A0A844YTP7_9SPHN|nr:tannase/feruloyl esterase family alpha/beta hydrolase [Alteraurantiacibacter buctensis]MXO70228.1 tannase/feruloyl esterase family alpha/beta hydrolase [Alteraurantiacibacter buctensis]
MSIRHGFAIATALGGTALAALAAIPGAAQGDTVPTAASCTALAQAALPNVEIGTAELVPAGPFTRPAGGPPQAGEPPVLPAHCLVRGTIDRRIGFGGREFGIGFELRLPLEWNGRFLFQGGGGLDGVLNPSIGAVANSGGPPALARGFAVVGTDSGHTGSIVDASFGLDQQARTDYAYNALDEVTQEAKRLIRHFYGAGPAYSYFVGCSNGGRQGLVASQHLPLEFDGIVAGDPAQGFSRLGLGEAWNMRTLARAAPRDADGRPIYARAFSQGDLDLVKGAVLNQCDALDGLADGFINDWRSCSFHPRTLVCERGKTESCLSPVQAEVLHELMTGPMTADGRHVYGPFTYDTGIASSAWRGMRLGTSETGQPNSADSFLGLNMLRYLQLTPPDPAWDPLAADWTVDQMLARIRYQGGIGDGDNPLLSTYALRGKMIVYNGLSDQGMSTPEIIRWHEAMVAATGQAGADAVRFFAVPGMLHCGGGEATDRFEMLDAIVDWVEHGRAPDRIEATSSTIPGVSRPLCPHPLVARYKGGDRNAASSFACEA